MRELEKILICIFHGTIIASYTQTSITTCFSFSLFHTLLYTYTTNDLFCPLNRILNALVGWLVCIHGWTTMEHCKCKRIPCILYVYAWPMLQKMIHRHEKEN